MCDRQTDRHTDKQTDRGTDRQTDRQTAETHSKQSSSGIIGFFLLSIFTGFITSLLLL